MNKPTFRPIAMRCNREQFESVRDILSKGGMEIDNISNNWDDLTYLVNNYDGKSKIVTNAYSTAKKYYDRTVFEEWDKDTFLEYCGIQSLPEKWAIRTCEEVGKWLDKNSDMPENFRIPEGYAKSNFKYLVYPSNYNSHMFEKVLKGYTKITIEQFREITKTNKPMSQKLTVPISEVLEIHRIACSNWQPIIGKYLSRVDSEQMITFTQEEVDKMFLAATSDQTRVLIKIFGEKVQIDYDKIKTGSKVMLKYTGEHIGGISEVDLDKPFDVVFFKSPWVIREKGEFKKGSTYSSHCTFHQDGNYVVFASNVDLDFIVSVIEY